MDPPTVLPNTLGFGKPHALALTDAVEQIAFLVMQVVRDQLEDGPTDHFLRAIPEHLFGGRVPAGHHAIYGFADDGISGRGNDGGKPLGGMLRLALAADVAGKAASMHELAALEVDAGIDQDLYDRSVLRSQLGRVILEHLTAGEPSQDVVDHRPARRGSPRCFAPGIRPADSPAGPVQPG